MTTRFQNEIRIALQICSGKTWAPELHIIQKLRSTFSFGLLQRDHQRRQRLSADCLFMRIVDVIPILNRICTCFMPPPAAAAALHSDSFVVEIGLETHSSFVALCEEISIHLVTRRRNAIWDKSLLRPGFRRRSVTAILGYPNQYYPDYHGH